MRAPLCVACVAARCRYSSSGGGGGDGGGEGEEPEEVDADEDLDGSASVESEDTRPPPPREASLEDLERLRLLGKLEAHSVGSVITAFDRAADSRGKLTRDAFCVVLAGLVSGAVGVAEAVPEPVLERIFRCRRARPTCRRAEGDSALCCGFDSWRLVVMRFWCGFAILASGGRGSTSSGGWDPWPWV